MIGSDLELSFGSITTHKIIVDMRPVAKTCVFQDIGPRKCFKIAEMTSKVTQGH